MVLFSDMMRLEGQNPDVAGNVWLCPSAQKTRNGEGGAHAEMVNPKALNP